MQSEIQKLKFYVANQTSLEDVSKFLRHLKKSGASQNKVIDFLNSLMCEEITEEKEDYLLEILDIVTGFCNEKYRVW